MSGLELAHFTVDMTGKIYVVSQLDRVLKIYAADGKDIRMVPRRALLIQP
jgi:hypothetical protein